MKRLLRLTVAAAAVAVLPFAWQGAAQADSAKPGAAADIKSPPGVPQLNISRPGGVAHIMPTVQGTAALQAFYAANAVGGANANDMTYHGGPTMRPFVGVYDIFWNPASNTLQNGASCVVAGSTSCFSATYGRVEVQVSAWYQAHGLWATMTQYSDSQTIANQTPFIQGGGGLGGFTVDATALPASGCTDTVTPGNCVTDAQLTTEIQAVMAKQGWTGSATGQPITNFFAMFTPNGEGSCFDNTNASCAYTQYCAYHSFFTSGSLGTVIYGNEPYGTANGCWITGTPSPNQDISADSASTALVHEIAESVTDPLINAWFHVNAGGEIGDLCNFNFGTDTWSSGNNGAGVLDANQMWNGSFFQVQRLWSNHDADITGSTTGCVQAGR